MSLYELDSYGNELYPLGIVKTMDGKKHRVEVVNNPVRYAQKKDGTLYYPLGIDGHEYMIEGLLQKTPTDYPISNDGFYIIPIDLANKLIKIIPTGNQQVNSFTLLKSNNIIEVFPGQKAHKTTIISFKKPRILRKNYSTLFLGSIVLIILIFLLGLRVIFRKLFEQLK